MHQPSASVLYIECTGVILYVVSELHTGSLFVLYLTYALALVISSFVISPPLLTEVK